MRVTKVSLGAAASVLIVATAMLAPRSTATFRADAVKCDLSQYKVSAGPFDAKGKSWVRFAVWDTAGNGAFVQPVWLNPPRTTD
jgi:hypothetical protein